MALTTGQAVASIAVMALVTFLTRALPFLLFDRGSAPGQHSPWCSSRRYSYKNRPLRLEPEGTVSFFRDEGLFQRTNRLSPGRLF